MSYVKPVKSITPWGLSVKQARLARGLTKLGLCLHPAQLVTPIKFSVPGGAVGDRRPGYICELCYAEVAGPALRYRTEDEK